MEKNFIINNNNLILLRNNKPQLLFTFHYFRKEVPGYQYCSIDNTDNVQFAILDINNYDITKTLIFKYIQNKEYIGAAIKNVWFKFYYKNENKSLFKKEKKISDEMSKKCDQELSEKYKNYCDNFSDIKKRKNCQKKGRYIKKNFRIYSQNKFEKRIRDKNKTKKKNNFRKNFKSEFFSEFVNYENQINEMWDIYHIFDDFDYYKSWYLTYIVFG